MAGLIGISEAWDVLTLATESTLLRCCPFSVSARGNPGERMEPMRVETPRPLSGKKDACAGSRDVRLYG